jgi:F0F1-type ATP synthase gamma subunit
MQRKMPAEAVDPSIVIVPITSDKGLCGATNSTIVRNTKSFVNKQNRAKC